MIALLLAAPSFLQAGDTDAFASAWERDLARWKEVQAARAPEPDLGAVALPWLEPDEGAVDPEALWRFLTDPATPWLAARAAALRCGDVFPLELLPRLLVARDELRAEEMQHGFGLRPHPMSSVAYPGWCGPLAAGEERWMLGRPWIVPAERSAWPLTFEEEAAAPWPWRALRTLDQVLNTIVPRGDPERTAAWLEVCLELPDATDAEARRFVLACPRGASLAVLARWRRYALDTDKPSAALAVADRLGSTHRMADDADVRLACRIVAAELLRGSPHPEARRTAAYGMRQLAEAWSPDAAVPVPPPPAAAILAAADLACDPATGGEWERFYVYALSACEALPEPPVDPDRRVSPGPEALERLDSFCAWLARERPALEARAAAQAPELERVERLLDALAR